MDDLISTIFRRALGNIHTGRMASKAANRKTTGRQCVECRMRMGRPMNKVSRHMEEVGRFRGKCNEFLELCILV